MKKLFLVFFPLIFITACAVPTTSIHSINRMSCYEITKKIGSYESKLKDEEIDSVSGAIDSIFSSNKEERLDGEADEFLADMNIDQIKGELQKLKRVHQQKRCYRR